MRTATATNGDVQIHYDVFGDAADPTLLLVNGLGSQCINYKDAWCEMFAAEALTGAGMATLAGGLSSHRPGVEYPVRYRAAHGRAVLAAIGVARAHVMGLSMGGMIVQTMAIEHPHRLITMTSVMSNTGEDEFRQSTPRAWELLTAPGATNKAEYVQQWIDGLHEWGSPEFADEARWAADAEAAFDRCFDPAGVKRQFEAVGRSGSRAERLPAVTTPTLVMHGDKDNLIFPIGGERTAALIPGARFELIAGMGHDYPPQIWRQWTDLVVGHIRAHS